MLIYDGNDQFLNHINLKEFTDEKLEDRINGLENSA